MAHKKEHHGKKEHKAKHHMEEMAEHHPKMAKAVKAKVAKHHKKEHKK